MNSRRAAGFAVAPAVLLAAALCSGPARADGVQLIGTIAVPGNPLASYDISFVDPHSRSYFLADRSNAGVDIFDTRTNSFVARIGGFKGFTGSNDTSGPDGVVADGDRLYAGDGDSTLKIIDIDSRQIINVISTGGLKRVDEMALDHEGGGLLVVNNADEPPFMTLISTRPENRVLFGHITVPGATGGLEQPVWDPRTKRFSISVPELNHDATQSGVAVFDPATGQVERVFNAGNSGPPALTPGPTHPPLPPPPHPPPILMAPP